MSDIMKMTVPGKAEYVRAVRMTASALASDAGFDIEEIDDIKVAISEACTNIVLHGAEDGSIHYDVAFELDDEKLVICVEDQGPGYDLEEYVEPVPGQIEESGGLGIFIIRALMDEVDIRSEVGMGTFICMKKYRHGTDA
ncbi:MAG: ATP-binding protein [Clostridiales Family XIII bacterium]|jgi:serine/threonine-protein kinase RsbW|nr:ATP-binding protein [Clostridiales Family XIII bacterium]